MLGVRYSDRNCNVTKVFEVHNISVKPVNEWTGEKMRMFFDEVLKTWKTDKLHHDDRVLNSVLASQRCKDLKFFNQNKTKDQNQSVP